MKRLIEKLLTEPMIKYPYYWIGPKEQGVVSRYCDHREGLRQNNDGPALGQMVFQSWSENSPAFRVTYTNCKSGRLRIKSTDLVIRYNEILREHKKRGLEGPSPSDSKVFLAKV